MQRPRTSYTLTQLAAGAICYEGVGADARGYRITAPKSAEHPAGRLVEAIGAGEERVPTFLDPSTVVWVQASPPAEWFWD